MKRKWWHDKVAYQIYPKSFFDTDGDGIGDLGGVLAKLDYLKELGIDIIWLSPVYKSPFVDQGYDISDYYRIAEEFGTMEQFDALLAETKKRGMYIVMDLVVNHCSDQHELFQKALRNPDGEEAGYFYFCESRDGKAPGNYRSYFGGPAWEPVPGSSKYYLHLFAKEQPDLNWTNPKLRRKVYDMVNWWLEKGVAGFRIDAIINIKKDTSFPSFEPDGEDGLCSCVTFIGASEGIGEYLRELKKETFEKYDAFTVGEVFHMGEGELEEFIGEDGYFSTVFDFTAQALTMSETRWCDSRPFVFREWRDKLFESQERAVGIGFEANIIENHDEPRGASRYLPDYLQNDRGKKLLGAVSMLMRGIPFVYQGQEIGMTNRKWQSMEEFEDINTFDQYQVALDSGYTQEEAFAFCCAYSRDNARTPMQWSAAKNAGFTDGTPWFGVNPDYREVNVEKQELDTGSVLHFYRELIALRKNPLYKETFVYGSFQPAFPELDTVYAYERCAPEGGQRILVAGNFGPEPVTLPSAAAGKVLLSNTGRTQAAAPLPLASGELAVLLL